MGNTFGITKKTTKVMKIDGETFKLKTPVKAGDVLKDHPGLVLLESEAVKHYGTRAKPLEAHKELLPKRLYFLVELPKETRPRRVRSGPINMSAKDRLETLMLTRRSASDLSIMKQSSRGGPSVDDNVIREENNKEGESNGGGGGGGVRLKMRLPKAEVERLMKDCKDEAEAADRIMSFYKANGVRGRGNSESSEIEENIGEKAPMLQLKGGRDRVKQSTKAPREKRVSFMPISEGGIQVAVAS